MSDTQRDFIYEKMAEEQQERHWARYDYCYKDCDGHNEQCGYYDSAEESWDFEECFEDKGW